MDAFTVMGAAASVSKEDEDLTSSQKTASSSKTQDRNFRNKTTASMVICSSCKTPLGIFKRKASLLVFVTSKKLVLSDVEILISCSISK